MRAAEVRESVVRVESKRPRENRMLLKVTDLQGRQDYTGMSVPAEAIAQERTGSKKVWRTEMSVGEGRWERDTVDDQDPRCTRRTKMRRY